MFQDDSFKNFIATTDIQHGLPTTAYTSEHIHALENEKIFSRSWILAGFKHELSNTGDARPITIANKPIVLVRGKDGEIKAFHNVCRHRCIKLVDEACNTGKSIRCPYHSWTYNLAGKLIATPFFGGSDHQPPKGFDKDDHGLIEVRCEVWHDWIYVNLDDNAGGSFEDFIDPIATRLSHINLDLLKPVAVLDFGVLETNWKFLMENFIEPYHVQFVHASTTDQPLVNHKILEDRHCLGCTVSAPEEVNREGTLAVDSNFLTLFPSFIMGTYEPDQIGVYLNTPLNAGQTHQRRAMYLVREDEIQQDEIDAIKKLWWDVHLEDHEMCDRMQLGRASHISDEGGVLSPAWESSVRRFQELILEGIQ